jgi:hypothetical protein
MQGWKSFKSEKYEIKFPGNWTFDTSKAMGTTFIIFSPLENSSDKFQENVNMLLQDLGGQNIDLDDYVQISEKQIRDMMTDGKIYESTRMKTSNGEYHKLLWGGTQGVFKLKFEQYCFIKDGKAAVVTLTTEADKFSAYQAVGEEILNTFALAK